MGLSEIVALHTFYSSSQVRTGTKSSSVLPVQLYKVERNDRFATGQTGPGLVYERHVCCGGISRLSCRSKGRNGLAVGAGDEEK